MFIYDRRSNDPLILHDPWICDFDYRISGVDYTMTFVGPIRNRGNAHIWYHVVYPVVERYFAPRPKPLEFWDYDDQNYFFYIKDTRDVVTLKLLLP